MREKRGRPEVPYDDIIIARGVSLPRWMWDEIDKVAEKNKRSAWIQTAVFMELDKLKQKAGHGMDSNV